MCLRGILAMCASEWFLWDFIDHFLLYILQWCCMLHHVLSYITLTTLQRAFRCHLYFHSIMKIAGWYTQQRPRTAIYYCCSFSNGPGVITTNPKKMHCIVYILLYCSHSYTHLPHLWTGWHWSSRFVFMVFTLKETCWWDHCDKSHRHTLCIWLIFMFNVVLSLW